MSRPDMIFSEKILADFCVLVPEIVQLFTVGRIYWVRPDAKEEAAWSIPIPEDLVTWMI